MGWPMRSFFSSAIWLLLPPLFAELAVLSPPPSPQNLVPIPAIFCTFTPCRTLLPSPSPLPPASVSPPLAAEIEPLAVAPGIPAEVATQTPAAVVQTALPPANLPPARPIVFDFVPSFETLVPPTAAPSPSLPFYQQGMVSLPPPPPALPAPLPISPPPTPAAISEIPLAQLPPQIRMLLNDLFLVSPQAVPPEPLPIEPLVPPPFPSVVPSPCPSFPPPPSHPCHFPHLTPFLPSPALLSTTVDVVNALAAPPPAAIAPAPAPLPLRYLSPAALPPPTPMAPLFSPYKKFNKERGKRNRTKGHNE